MVRRFLQAFFQRKRHTGVFDLVKSHNITHISFFLNLFSDVNVLSRQVPSLLRVRNDIKGMRYGKGKLCRIMKKR